MRLFCHFNPLLPTSNAFRNDIYSISQIPQKTFLFSLNSFIIHLCIFLQFNFQSFLSLRSLLQSNAYDACASVVSEKKLLTFDWSCCCSNCSLINCSCRIISDSWRSFSAKLSAHRTLWRAATPSCCTCASVFGILPASGGERATLFATMVVPPL